MCYGHGGEEPTVTDANLLLGYLNPDFFAGGTLQIQPALARAGFERLGATLGHGAVETAWGVHDIVAENMAAAARVHVAERGQDPRRFVLVATGGGGPLHAYHVARKIGVSTIVCPPQAGVASAFGLLVAQARADRSRSFSFKPASDAVAGLEEVFAALEQEVRGPLQALQADFGPVRLRRRADGRFIGQGFNLGVDLPDGPYTAQDADAEARWRDQLDQAFRSAYAAKFGRTPPDVPVELVNLQVTGEAAPLRPFQAAALQAQAATAQASGSRPVYFAESQGFVTTPIYQRAQLRPGVQLAGPALIEEETTTVVVGPRARATVTAQANLVIQIEEASA